MATAGGTLVLAVATFASIRSANRSARVAERSLLAAQRPILIPSRDDDPIELVRFGDGVVVSVQGHGGALQVIDGRIYMTLSLRNAGAGVAVIHGWHAQPGYASAVMEPPELSSFRRQLRDLYIPAGTSGFWQAAVRDPGDAWYGPLRRAAEQHGRAMIDLLYGDHEGGQRAIVRFGVWTGEAPEGEERPGEARSDVLRYWNVDGSDPR